MGIGPKEILIIAVIALLLFGGAGKISALMGDFAKGIKAFRKGLQDEEPKIENRAEKVGDATPKANDGTR